MFTEVKSNQKAFPKAIKQLCDGKERLQEVYSAIGLTTKFRFVGVFYAHVAANLPMFDCEPCTTFAIVGEENIPGNMEQIEELVMESHENWNPSDHVEEFVELSKQLLFIAQGDPYAPVTGSNIVAKTLQHVLRASNVESIFLWTPEQLSLIQAMTMLYVFIDAFYSTGKTEVLKYYGKGKIKSGEPLHYFNHRPVKMKGNLNLLPFTLVLQGQFPEGVVKETTFQFGVDSVRGFLQEHGIEPHHHVIFDELICTRYDKQFLDSLKALKENVKSLWVAMGAQPVTGKKIKKQNRYLVHYIYFF